jgi:hypothetical protein
MRRPMMVVFGALGMLLTGCGGDEGGDEPQLFRLGPTKACLEQLNVPIRTRGLDFVAETALGGGVFARFAGNHVTLAFGETEGGAQGIENRYREQAADSIQVDKVIMRKANVVMVWAGGPNASDLGVIERCLTA